MKFNRRILLKGTATASAAAVAGFGSTKARADVACPAPAAALAPAAKLWIPFDYVDRLQVPSPVTINHQPEDFWSLYSYTQDTRVPLENGGNRPWLKTHLVRQHTGGITPVLGVDQVDGELIGTQRYPANRKAFEEWRDDPDPDKPQQPVTSSYSSVSASNMPKFFRDESPLPQWGGTLRDDLLVTVFGVDASDVEASLPTVSLETVAGTVATRVFAKLDFSTHASLRARNGSGYWYLPGIDPDDAVAPFDQNFSEVAVNHTTGVTRASGAAFRLFGAAFHQSSQGANWCQMRTYLYDFDNDLMKSSPNPTANRVQHTFSPNSLCIGGPFNIGTLWLSSSDRITNVETGLLWMFRQWAGTSYLRMIYPPWRELSL